MPQKRPAAELGEGTGPTNVGRVPRPGARASSPALHCRTRESADCPLPTTHGPSGLAARAPHRSTPPSERGIQATEKSTHRVCPGNSMRFRSLRLSAA